MNGVPCGFFFAVMPKMGAWAFVSLPSDGIQAQGGPLT